MTTQTGAQLTWTATDASNLTTWVEYGRAASSNTVACPKPTSGTGSGMEVSECIRSANVTGPNPRSVTFTGLATDQWYKFWIVAVDAHGNRATHSGVFRTGSTATSTSTTTTTGTTTTTTAAPDTTPPSIIGVTAGTPTQTSANIGYSVTDAHSGVATSRVEFGPTTALGTTVSASAGPGPKAVALTGLTAGTTYHYRVVAVDVAGNTGNNPTTGTLQFTTAAVPTVDVSGITVGDLVHESFTVSWNVAGSGAATSRVEYGTTTAYGSQGAVQNGAGAKSTTITGLVEGTTYFFRVMGNDGSATDSETGSQRTANLYEVEVISTGSPSFSPSTLNVVAGEPFVVRVTNSAGSGHGWMINGESYTTRTAFPSDMPNGQVYTFTSSKTLAAGSYTMSCPPHSGFMTGSIVAA